MEGSQVVIKSYSKMGCIFLNVFHLCLLGCYLVPAIGEKNFNASLCPKPVVSAASKRLHLELSNILKVRYQLRTETKTYFSRRVHPSSFIKGTTLSLSSSSSLPPLPSPKSAENTEVTSIKIQFKNEFAPISGFVFLVLLLLICSCKRNKKAERLHHRTPISTTETLVRRHNGHHHNNYQQNAIDRDLYEDIYFGGNGEGGGPQSDINDDSLLRISYEPSSPMITEDAVSVVEQGGGDGVVVREPENLSSASTFTNGKYLVHLSDPPPSYDTLSPPSYNELFYAVPPN